MKAAPTGLTAQAVGGGGIKKETSHKRQKERLPTLQAGRRKKVHTHSPSQGGGERRGGGGKKNSEPAGE